MAILRRNLPGRANVNELINICLTPPTHDLKVIGYLTHGELGKSRAGGVYLTETDISGSNAHARAGANTQKCARAGRSTKKVDNRVDGLCA